MAVVETDWRERLVMALRTGLPLHVSDLNPSTDEGWNESHRISAELIRDCLLQRRDVKPDPRGLEIHGAHITGDLDLEWERLAVPIRLIRCRLATVNVDHITVPELDLSLSAAFSVQAESSHFVGDFILTGATLCNPGWGALNLDKAVIGGDFSANNLRATGSVSASRVKIGGSIDVSAATLVGNLGLGALSLDGAEVTGHLNASGLKAHGEVHAPGIRTGGDIDLDNAHLRAHPGGDALDLYQAQIIGDISARKLKATGEVNVSLAKVGGSLYMGDSNLSGSPDRPSLSLISAEVEGALHASNIEASGLVFATHLKVGGSVFLDGAALVAGLDGEALTLTSARIVGQVLAWGMNVTGHISASGLNVGGSLHMQEATLSGGSDDALNLTDAAIAGDLTADRLRATGTVDASRTRVGGHVSLYNADLSSPGGDALRFIAMDIVGNLSAIKLRSHGQVYAALSKIGGSLNLDEAIVIGDPYDIALLVSYSEITGNLFASKLMVTGSATAAYAKVGGRVDLAEAILDGSEGPYALNLDSAYVASHLDASNLRASGKVSALSLHVGGEFSLDDAAMSNPGGDHALILIDATVRHLGLDLSPDTCGTFDMTAATISNLVISKPPRIKLISSGLSVGDLHGQIRIDRNLATSWIDSAPEFVSQPWQEIADVYERNGQPTDARRIRIAAAHRTAKHSPWPSKAVRYGYGVLVGYGYWPLLTVAWMMIVVAVTLGFSVDRSAFSPTQITYAKSGSTAPMCSGLPLTAASPQECLSINYPHYDPVLYAVTTVTPAAALQNPAWAPTGAFRSIGLGVAKLCGWLLTAVLLAGLTGLLKKT